VEAGAKLSAQGLVVIRLVPVDFLLAGSELAELVVDELEVATDVILVPTVL
jgi:hypothetical protein